MGGNTYTTTSNCIHHHHESSVTPRDTQLFMSKTTTDDARVCHTIRFPCADHKGQGYSYYWGSIGYEIVHMKLFKLFIVG